MLSTFHLKLAICFIFCFNSSDFIIIIYISLKSSIYFIKTCINMDNIPRDGHLKIMTTAKQSFDLYLNHPKASSLWQGEARCTSRGQLTSLFLVFQKTTQCSVLSGLVKAYTTVLEKYPHWNQVTTTMSATARELWWFSTYVIFSCFFFH